jgi:DNA repair protein RadC
MSTPILYITDVNNPTRIRAATLDEIMAAARHALSIRVRKGTLLDSPKATSDYLTARLAQREYEVFTHLPRQPAQVDRLPGPLPRHH